MTDISTEFTQEYQAFISSSMQGHIDLSVQRAVRDSNHVPTDQVYSAIGKLALYNVFKRVPDALDLKNEISKEVSSLLSWAKWSKWVPKGTDHSISVTLWYDLPEVAQVAIQKGESVSNQYNHWFDDPEPESSVYIQITEMAA